jgi:hypothetical protein
MLFIKIHRGRRKGLPLNAMKTYDRNGDKTPSTFYLGFRPELSGQVYGHVDLPSREESAVATY